MSSGRPLGPVYHDSLISVNFTLNSAQRNFTPHNLLAVLHLLLRRASTSSLIDDGRQARKEGV